MNSPDDFLSNRVSIRRRSWPERRLWTRPLKGSTRRSGAWNLRWSGGWRGSPPHAVVVEAVLDGGTDRERRWRFEQLVLPGAGTVTLGTLDVED